MWRILAISLTLTIAGFLFSCSEKLPEGPGTEFEDVLLVQLTTDFESYAQENTYRDEYNTPAGMNRIEFDMLTTWKVYFRVRVENIFDEPVVGTKHVDATIHIWNKNDPSKVRTLTVVDTLSEEIIIIQPGYTYTVVSDDRFIWDQTYHPEEPIAPKDTFLSYQIVERITYDRNKDAYYRHCDTLSSFWADSVIAFRNPIEIQAQASVQLFQEFKGMYWKSDVIEFPIVFLSHAGWEPLTEKCNEGPVIEIGP